MFFVMCCLAVGYITVGAPLTEDIPDVIAFFCEKCLWHPEDLTGVSSIGGLATKVFESFEFASGNLLCPALRL